jgi:hypothetical protein
MSPTGGSRGRTGSTPSCGVTGTTVGVSAAQRRTVETAGVATGDSVPRAPNVSIQSHERVSVRDREGVCSTSIRASGASAVPGRRGRRPSRPSFSSTFLGRVVRRRRTRGGKTSRYASRTAFLPTTGEYAARPRRALCDSLQSVATVPLAHGAAVRAVKPRPPQPIRSFAPLSRSPLAREVAAGAATVTRHRTALSARGRITVGCTFVTILGPRGCRNRSPTYSRQYDSVCRQSSHPSLPPGAVMRVFSDNGPYAGTPS